jgi:hypothetical protein
MGNIPSDEELARAKRLAKERFRNLDQVRESVLRRFRGRCPLHDFVVLPQGEDVEFRAYVFFKEDKDIETCRANGMTNDLAEAVYEELELAGRGSKEAVAVVFEFDSDENVSRVFRGNYYNRLL